MLTRLTPNTYLMILLRIVILTTRSLILYRLLELLEGTEGVCCEVYACAFYLGGLENELTQGAEIALAALGVAEGVAHAVAPEADVALDARADLLADGAVVVCDVAALPPLMVEFRRIVLSHDVLAIGFPQLGEPTNLMYNNRTLLALQYFRKPPIRQLPTQITEIKRLQFRLLPFMLRRPKLIPHHLLLYTNLRQRLGLQYEDQRYDRDEDGNQHRNRKYHLINYSFLKVL